MNEETALSQHESRRPPRNGPVVAAAAEGRPTVTTDATREAPAPASAEAATAPRRSGARRGYALAGGFTLVLAVGIAAYVLVTQGKEDTDDAQVSAAIVPVGTRVAGQIVQVSVVENQLVKKGDPVAVIDDA